MVIELQKVCNFCKNTAATIILHLSSRMMVITNETSELDMSNFIWKQIIYIWLQIQYKQLLHIFTITNTMTV